MFESWAFNNLTLPAILVIEKRRGIQNESKIEGPLMQKSNSDDHHGNLFC